MKSTSAPTKHDGSGTREQRPLRLTHHYRQFLQQLRHGGWVRGTDLKGGARVRLNAIQGGWVEYREEKGKREYRITPKGVADLRQRMILTWA